MSSTDEAKLRRFYRDELCAAADALSARGVRFFPLGPEPERETWYERVPPGLPELISFEPDEAERLVREQWEREGLPELARLARRLFALAHGLELSEEQSADVSPFVYVMY
jgi:hypothetical protein